MLHLFSVGCFFFLFFQKISVFKTSFREYHLYSDLLGHTLMPIFVTFLESCCAFLIFILFAYPVHINTVLAVASF